MEFEENAPTTADDVSRAEIPHITIQPFHTEVAPEVITSSVGLNASARLFKFETESTSSKDSESDTSRHPHHRIALTSAIVISLLFAAGVTLLALHR